MEGHSGTEMEAHSGPKTEAHGALNIAAHSTNMYSTNIDIIDQKGPQLR